MKKLLITIGLAISLASFSGCALFGKNAGPPTAAERKFFDVTTNYVPHIEVITNYQIVTVPSTNYQQVTVTNQIGVSVTKQVPVTTYQTNVLAVTQFVTNQIPQYQLSPGTGANTVQTIGGAIAAPFGFGGLVTTALGGILASYLGLRNRALKGDSSALAQTSGVLTQNIETLMEVLKTTPQGTQVLPFVKNYLVQHQAEEGVVEQVGTIVASSVKNEDAKNAAQSIVDALKAIKATP